MARTSGLKSSSLQFRDSFASIVDMALLKKLEELCWGSVCKHSPTDELSSPFEQD